MRVISAFIAILALVPLVSVAQETPPAKAEYAEFSKLVHRIVVKSLPKQFEDTASWGQTIPAPPKLILPQLRKFVKVGDRLEVPHGPWRKSRGRIEDLERDLKINVKDFKALDDKVFRLVLDVDAIIMVQGEWQQWQKGLLLFDVEAVGDAHITAAIVCDIGATLDFTKFPPEINIEPKVQDLGLNLVDFKFRNIGPLIPAEQANSMNKELNDVLRTVLKASETVMMDFANEAIARSLKEGKGRISAATILKAVPTPKDTKKLKK